MSLNLRTFILIWSLLSLLAKSTGANYVVEVNADSYRNRDHEDINGDCCDDIFFCNNECDNRFSFCLRPDGTAQDDDATNCPMGGYNTPVVGDDNFNFDATMISSRVPNPMLFRVRGSWPGTVQLLVTIFDEDDGILGGNDDEVDNIYIPISVSQASAAWTPWTWYNGGRGSGNIELRFRVQCAEHYYGGNCETRCEPHDDSTGHYTCDSNGHKVCLTGWTGTYRRRWIGTTYIHDCLSCATNYYGTDCDVHCEPHDDSTGHYTCDSNGGKVCLTGWTGSDCLSCATYYYGDNCDVYCEPHDDSTGHYTCDSNGGKVCLTGWTGSDCLSCATYYYGDNCDMYCEPHDDSTGHYTCNSNGGKVCLTGWTGFDCLSCATYYYGSDCGTYCYPRDNYLGHYTCGTNGEKICRTGWAGSDCLSCATYYYGTNCVVYCYPRDDSIGHYTCDSNRAKVCRTRWTDTSTNCVTCAEHYYGDDCDVYCEPHDNYLGHYTCNSDGGKVCIDGWTGSTCLNNINDCAPNPCHNGGTCEDGVATYDCMCPTGFDGLSCENNIDECVPDPCRNGGTCQDLTNDYKCVCALGYCGDDCEIMIDECYPATTTLTQAVYTALASTVMFTIASTAVVPSIIPSTTSTATPTIAPTNIFTGAPSTTSTATTLPPENKPIKGEDGTSMLSRVIGGSVGGLIVVLVLLIPTLVMIIVGLRKWRRRHHLMHSKRPRCAVNSPLPSTPFEQSIKSLNENCKVMGDCNSTGNGKDEELYESLDYSNIYEMPPETTSTNFMNGISKQLATNSLAETTMTGIPSSTLECIPPDTLHSNHYVQCTPAPTETMIYDDTKSLNRDTVEPVAYEVMACSNAALYDDVTAVTDIVRSFQ